MKTDKNQIKEELEELRKTHAKTLDDYLEGYGESKELNKVLS